jgi:hypothetical protein
MVLQGEAFYRRPNIAKKTYAISRFLVKFLPVPNEHCPYRRKNQYDRNCVRVRGFDYKLLQMRHE